MKPRIPKDISRPSPKVRPNMDPEHLANVRKLPCCVCEERGWEMEAHHLLRTGDPTQRGTGRKAEDRFAIPLCKRPPSREGCHDRLHDDGDEEGFLARHGVQGRELAALLWRNKGDPEAMETSQWKLRHHGRAA